MGWRHQLCLDTRGLAVSGGDIGPAFLKGHWLGRQQSHETGPGNQGAEHGHRIQNTAGRNIVHTTTRRSCANMGSRCRCLGKAIDMIMQQSRPSSKLSRPNWPGGGHGKHDGRLR